MDSLDYWRLCDELTIVQAALLLAGFTPEEYMGKIEGDSPDKRPAGYDACKSAITEALKKGDILGTIVEQKDFDPNFFYIYEVEGTVDYYQSKVDVSTLKKWLRGRGINTGFFFPEIEGIPDYLNPTNIRYAPKLAASVNAWLAVTDPGSKSPKQALEKWLRENASRYGLVDEDGNPVGQAVEDCSKIANWKTTGGAPKYTKT